MCERLAAPRPLLRAGALLAACTLAAHAQQPKQPTAHAGPSKYIFAWTGDSARKANDFLAVIDADPASKTYGHVVTSVATNVAGAWPHHTEYEFPKDGVLLANGFAAGRSFVFDLRRPTAPRVIGSFTTAGPYSFPHSFVRLPNGHLLATMQGKGGAYAPPGGLVELDERGTPIRSASAVGLGLSDTLAWPYSLALDAKHDRAVVTLTTMLPPSWMHAPAGSWPKARVEKVDNDQIEVWSISALKLLDVIDLPKPANTKRTGENAINLYPAEPRLLPDGSMYVNTFNCGLYHVTAIDTPKPRVELVYEFPYAPMMSCAVPAIIGHYWVQTVGSLPALIALDIADPAHPVEVSRLMLDKQQGMPHWLASDANANRVVLTNDGRGFITVIDVDPRTGALAIDRRFRDERTGAVGVNLDGRRWPHGEVAHALVHGTLFGPR